MNIPDHLKYTKDHEWLKLLGSDEALVGITDFAQNSLGDITFAETPQVGERFTIGETFGVVESVKAASDLYMPVDGEVIAINETLEDAPETLNQDPYGDGWILKIRLFQPVQIEALLDAAAYAEVVSE